MLAPATGDHDATLARCPTFYASLAFKPEFPAPGSQTTMFKVVSHHSCCLSSSSMPVLGQPQPPAVSPCPPHPPPCVYPNSSSPITQCCPLPKGVSLLPEFSTQTSSLLAKVFPHQHPWSDHCCPRLSSYSPGSPILDPQGHPTLPPTTACVYQSPQPCSFLHFCLGPSSAIALISSHYPCLGLS